MYQQATNRSHYQLGYRANRHERTISTWQDGLSENLVGRELVGLLNAMYLAMHTTRQIFVCLLLPSNQKMPPLSHQLAYEVFRLYALKNGCFDSEFANSKWCSPKWQCPVEYATSWHRGRQGVGVAASYWSLRIWRLTSLKIQCSRQP